MAKHDYDTTVARDARVRQMPAERPSGERLMLNAYGRECYDAGRLMAEARLATLAAVVREVEQELSCSGQSMLMDSDDHNAREAAREMRGWADRLSAALTECKDGRSMC